MSEDLLPDGAKLAADVPVDSVGVMFIIWPTPISSDYASYIREHLQAKMPNRAFAILPPGAQVIDSQSPTRLDTKLDLVLDTLKELAASLRDFGDAAKATNTSLAVLLQALASEGMVDPNPDGDEPAFDLDGNAAGKPREPGISLDG